MDNSKQYRYITEEEYQELKMKEYWYYTLFNVVNGIAENVYPDYGYWCDVGSTPAVDCYFILKRVKKDLMRYRKKEIRKWRKRNKGF